MGRRRGGARDAGVGRPIGPAVGAGTNTLDGVRLVDAVLEPMVQDDWGSR